jgi:hypothetical protein
MFKLSLDLTFNNESKNHNEFESQSPPFSFLDHLASLTTLTMLHMVVTMLNDNISAFNAAILPISNGIVLFTLAKPVIK